MLAWLHSPGERFKRAPTCFSTLVMLPKAPAWPDGEPVRNAVTSNVRAEAVEGGMGTNYSSQSGEPAGSVRNDPLYHTFEAAPIYT